MEPNHATKALFTLTTQDPMNTRLAILTSLLLSSSLLAANPERRVDYAGFTV
jgi:hypothetical protein